MKRTTFVSIFTLLSLISFTCTMAMAASHPGCDGSKGTATNTQPTNQDNDQHARPQGQCSKDNTPTRDGAVARSYQEQNQIRDSQTGITLAVQTDGLQNPKTCSPQGSQSEENAMRNQKEHGQVVAADVQELKTNSQIASSGKVEGQPVQRGIEESKKQQQFQEVCG